MPNVGEFTGADQRPSPVIASRVIEIAGQTDSFYDPDLPIPGITNDVLLAPDLRTLLDLPETTLTTIGDRPGEVSAFSLAVPIGLMVPSRKAQSHDTAYIYYVAVDPAQKGQGLGTRLTSKTFKALRRQGYTSAELDAIVSPDYAASYADQLEKRYKNAILRSHDHDVWQIGPERFIRLDLCKATRPKSLLGKLARLAAGTAAAYEHADGMVPGLG